MSNPALHRLLHDVCCHGMLTENEIAASYLVNGASISALAVLLYDIAITFDKEVAYIWTRPNTSWVKWAFFFARYFAVLTQMSHRFLALAVNNDFRLNVSVIKGIFGLQGLLAELQALVVEIVLMVRVYALYRKRRWVKYAFGGLILGELIAVIFGVVHTIPGATFNLLTSSASISQLIIMVLTAVRTYSINRQLDSRPHILNLLIRDSFFSFVILFVLSILMLYLTVIKSEYTNMLFAWFVTLLATVTCRMIINMQEIEESETSFELTTVGPQFRSQSSAVQEGALSKK